MRRIIFLLFVFLCAFQVIKAQEDPYEELLKEKILIENPIYKPVIAFGTGVLNFHGDVRNNNLNPLIGDNAFKLNLSAFVDPGRYFKVNFFLIYGSLSGNASSLINMADNLNFKTDIVDFGVNAEYTFNHFFKKRKWIKPFLSVGMENLQFTPKGDLFGSEGIFYNYWSDGTIRNIPELPVSSEPSILIYRDYVYETDLRSWENDQYGLGNYGKNTFSIPLDAGLDFRVSERVNCRLGTSLHFTMTDFLDNVGSSAEDTYHQGNSRKDFFSYNYFTVHLDLFSQPKEQIIEKLFLELDFDDIMFGDEDGDFILDPVDECPETPYGVIVDAKGCPLDGDNDGVPDHLDDEPNTAQGAWIDKNGITVTEEQFMELITRRNEAMSREDVNNYLNTIGKGYTRKIITEIPQKFKKLDKDKDGYISFDELLRAIDDYFDDKLKYSVEDIYELNNLFFAQ